MQLGLYGEQDGHRSVKNDYENSHCLVSGVSWVVALLAPLAGIVDAECDACLALARKT